MTSIPPDDALLAHAAFLRRLAQRLVWDEHEREDLLQEAWAAAYATRGQGRDPANPRAWLARILRSRVFNRARDRSRREARERSAARDEAGEGVREGLDVQEKVLAAVSELREPYRTAIYLRYYEDLQPSVIAERLGVPVATVDTRLLRARAQLRERLNHRLGGPGVWTAALLPLCPTGSPPPPVGLPTGSVLSAGVVGMKLKIALGLATGAAALLVTWPWGRGIEGSPPLESRTARISPARLESEPVPSAVEAGVPVAIPERAEVASGAPGPVVAEETPATPAAAAPRLEGIVLDVAGSPLASAQLRFVPASGASMPFVGDASGRFTLEDLPGAGHVETSEPGWVTVVQGALLEGVAEGETTVIAAPAFELSVRVVDPEQEPLPGAQVSVVIPPSLRSSFEFDLQESTLVRIRARADSLGRVELSAPAVPGLALLVRMDGYENLMHELQADLLLPYDTVDRELVLHPLDGREHSLSGRVVDRYGNGIDTAIVELGRLGTRTDGEGRFHFDLLAKEPFRNVEGKVLVPRLSAAAEGLLPVVVEASVGSDGEPVWPKPLLLQLVDEPLSISGRVVDQGGSPLPGAIVFLPRAHLIGLRTTVEAELRGEEEGGEFLFERADARGRFVFRGLMDEDYELAAFHEGSLVRGDVRAAAGSSGVEVRIDTDHVWPEVRGRVVDRDSNPLPGVRVTPRLWTQSAVNQATVWHEFRDGTPTTSDEEGRFVLTNVPRSHVTAELDHPEVMRVFQMPFQGPSSREDEDGNLVGCELVGPLRMRFQVRLDEPTEADRFRVLDGDGQPMRVWAQWASLYNSNSAYYELEEGLSEHLFVGEEAETLVLLRGDEEVRRVALRLRWREETVVR